MGLVLLSIVPAWMRGYCGARLYLKIGKSGSQWPHPNQCCRRFLRQSRLLLQRRWPHENKPRGHSVHVGRRLVGLPRSKADLLVLAEWLHYSAFPSTQRFQKKFGTDGFDMNQAAIGNDYKLYNPPPKINYKITAINLNPNEYSTVFWC